MSTGWLGGNNASGGLSLNAIVAGMDKYLRISRPKIHAWGNSGKLSQNPGGVPNSVGVNATTYNEVTPQMLIPVEVDCELVKSDIINDSMCFMPLSARSYSVSNVDKDVNLCEYKWWVEQWRGNALIGQINYTFKAAGELPPPYMHSEFHPKFQTATPTTNKYGLAWFQKSNDSSQKTKPSDIRLITSKGYSTSTHNASGVNVYPDTSGDLSTKYKSIKAFVGFENVDFGNSTKDAYILDVLNSADISSSYFDIIDTKAQFSYNSNGVRSITGSLQQGTTVKVRLGLTRNDEVVNLMIEKSIVVDSNGGVELSGYHSYISLDSNASKNISWKSGEYDFDLDNVYVSTSTNGLWERVTGLNNASRVINVTTEVNVGTTPIDYPSDFLIKSHDLPILPSEGTLLTYYNNVNGTGQIIFGTEPILKGTACNTVYRKEKFKLHSPVPDGFDLWMCMDSNTLSPGDSKTGGIVNVDSEGWVSEVTMNGKPNISIPTVSTVDEIPPTQTHDAISFNDKAGMPAFPSKLVLRKGDLITLRSTTDTSMGGAAPDPDSASRAYEMGCEIRLPINLT